VKQCHISLLRDSWNNVIFIYSGVREIMSYLYTQGLVKQVHISILRCLWSNVIFLYSGTREAMSYLYTQGFVKQSHISILRGSWNNVIFLNSEARETMSYVYEWTCFTSPWVYKYDIISRTPEYINMTLFHESLSKEIWHCFTVVWYYFSKEVFVCCVWRIKYTTGTNNWRCK
jgi:hypothetical protein